MGKYIKLYEEANASFEPIDYRKWPEYIKDIVSFDTNKVKALPKDLKIEIKKTIQVGDRTHKRRITDSPFTPNDKIDYLLIEINSSLVFVYEKEDEYYAVFTEGIVRSGRKSYHFKCDQIEGLIQCLDHIKSII